MSYDYSKLLGKIVEKCGTQLIFSERMGLSERTISLKLNRRVPWKDTEIIKAAEILGIPNDEIVEYFFKIKVHEMWTKHRGEMNNEIWRKIDKPNERKL